MKNYLSILIVFLLFGITSCIQDDFISDPNIEDQSLKSCEIGDGKYAGDLSNGAQWYISLPEDWDAPGIKFMIFYAHGLEDPEEGPNLPNDTISGKTIEEIVNGMGFAYATTSYRDDGFVALYAVEDILLLRDKVTEVLAEHNEQQPTVRILGGPSEGGLVTALTLENPNHGFNGGLSICGPIGSFSTQMQYNGDFHVLFNYFFGEELAMVAPGFSTGSPLGVGDAIMNQWRYGVLPFAVQQVLEADIRYNESKKLKQLLKCAKVTVDMNDPIAMGTVALQCLRYNIMITDDMKERLNGVVPYNNKYKWYRGSSNDRKLNREVQRINTSFYIIRRSIKKYETTGRINVPFVTIHTTGDHVTPFWHNPIYRLKALFSGNSLLHTGIPVNKYGHCTIEESHIVAGLGIIITKIGLMQMFAVDQSVFSSTESLENFKVIMQENSVDFEIN